MDKTAPSAGSQKGKSTVIIILGIIIILVVLLIAFYGDKLPLVKPSYQVLAPSPNPINGTKAYNNESIGFNFNYPANWVVAEIDGKNEKMLHSILQVTPAGFKGKIPPIKLLYTDNPRNLSLAALDKSVASTQNMPIFYSVDDVYTLSGGGLPAYYRAQGDCVATKCQIYTISFGNRVYQLVSFTDVNIPNQKQIFDQIFNSLKFTNTPQNSSTNSAKPKTPGPSATFKPD